MEAGPILESKSMREIFQKRSKKRAERAKYLKFGQKCIKSENISKRGSLMRATIACMRQLEYAAVEEKITLKLGCGLYTVICFDYFLNNFGLQNG